MSNLSIFDKADARSNRQVDRVHGEAVFIRAMIRGINTKPRPDPDRRDFEVRGVWISKPVGGNDDLRVSDKKIQQAENESWFSVDVSTLPATILQGDHLTRLKSGHTYRVKAINSDGEGRLNVYVQLITGEARAAITN